MKPYIIRRLIAAALLAFWTIVALAIYFIVRRIMLWSDIQAACEEADFLYEETGKHHAVIQVGSMMMVVEHNSMLRHMYSTTRYK